MSKKLTKELIIQKIRSDNFKNLKNLNLWGINLEDISLLTQLPNLEIISLSVNKIRTLKPFSYLPKLRELYLRKNLIADLNEIKYLIENLNLRVLWLSENPICENPNYRNIVISVLPQINKLDDIIITEEERINANKGIFIQISQIKNNNNNINLDSNNNFNNKNEKLSQKNFYVNNNNSYYDEFIVKESKIKTNKSYDENINIDNHHSQRKKYKMKKINKKNQYEVSSSNSEFEKENLIKYERKKNKNKRNNFDDKEIRINNQIDDNKHYKKIKRQNDYYTEDYIKNYRNDKNYIRSNLRYNNNLLHCVLMLLDELNEDELDIVRRKIQLKRNNNYY
jgi:hypothetical protein